MSDLTPYDTGARLQPRAWVPALNPGNYGKVDFENEESATVLTLHVERAGDGYKIVVDHDGFYAIAVAGVADTFPKAEQLRAVSDLLAEYDEVEEDYRQANETAEETGGDVDNRDLWAHDDGLAAVAHSAVGLLRDLTAL